MHRSQYKFSKKRKKCDVSVKSTITKRTISIRKKKGGCYKTKKKSTKRETKSKREREYDLFCFGQLGRNRREVEWKQ